MGIKGKVQDFINNLNAKKVDTKLEHKNTIQKNDIEKIKKEIGDKNKNKKGSINEPAGNPFGVVLKKVPNK